MTTVTESEADPHSRHAEEIEPMIHPEDVEFHAADEGDLTWAETNFFGFYNAELTTNVGVYTLFRPNLGVVHSTISINSGDAYQPWQADFIDHQCHVPIPEPRSLASYTLANGLSVRTIEPNMAWKIEYDDNQGTTIDVTYTSLMQPFDIQDPDMDPITAARSKEEGFAWGTAYNGHFDQTGRFQGLVTVRGREIPIDCVSTMDHSWGPRKERGGPNMSWLHAHFGDDYFFHTIWSFDHTGDSDQLTLNHGYVQIDGELRGLAGGTGVTLRDEHLFARTVSFQVEDSKGEIHEVTGRGLTRFPWQAWPNMVGFNVLGEWESRGRTGHGEIQDFVDATTLTARAHTGQHAAAGRA
jgi:hypothetical protein